MRESRKAVEGAKLGSEVRLRCLRLSHQPVSSRRAAIIGGRVASNPTQSAPLFSNPALLTALKPRSEPCLHSL